MPELHVDIGGSGLSADTVIRALEAGEPRIHVGEDQAWRDILVVNPMGLNKGEGQQVASPAAADLRRAVMTAPVYSLHAIPVATLPAPGWEAFFGVNDQEFYDLAFYVWVVTDGASLGLIDTGLPLDPATRARLDEANRALDERHTFTGVRTLPQVLDEYGIAGDDVDFVAITQTITYHTGGLEAAVLPRAQVYLSRAGIHEMLADPPGHPASEHYFTEAGLVIGPAVRHRGPAALCGRADRHRARDRVRDYRGPSPRLRGLAHQDEGGCDRRA